MRSLADELRAEFPSIASEELRLAASVEVLRVGFWRRASLVVTDRAVYVAWIERGRISCLCLTGRDVARVERSSHLLTPLVELSMSDASVPPVRMRSRRRPRTSGVGWGVRVAETEPGVDFDHLERALRSGLIFRR